MTEMELTTTIEKSISTAAAAYFRAQPLTVLASMDGIELHARRLALAVMQRWLAVWVQVLQEAALKVAKKCPVCGKDRTCKRRSGQPMQLRLLGVEVELPKLYLECEHCKGKGVSIVRLLTGLSSGESSGELNLMSAYCAAEHSYGKAGRDLEAHYGRPVERTAVRRMTLEVEEEALIFAEQQRQAALARVSGEGQTQGVARLMLQGDGGTVRTGMLVACERGDAGYRKKTAKKGRVRRKRATQKRELITLDVRQPGDMQATALDVVVPVVAKEGERERRMLALASRKGLGSNTEVIGLGDLGSRLPQSFDEAFVGYQALYSGDWKHTCNYVEQAAAVLTGIDTADWTRRMKDALWKRNATLRDQLLAQAHQKRIKDLPANYERCPVKALDSYAHNNWKYLNAARLKQKGLEFVSARAEAQVRDRTKSRFSVPGAWREENLEGKATLRAIIADGRWGEFRSYYREQRTRRFQVGFYERSAQAVAEGRLCAGAELTPHATPKVAETAMLKAA
jgi:hypothetical protein